MSELKVIENELVPVYETSTGEKIVYGTKLHEVLQSRQDFSTWVKKRLLECDAIENTDYDTAPLFYGTANGGNSTRTEYLIKLDTAKEMAMLERNEKGKQVRRYFIAVEKKYKENPYEELSQELKAVIIVDKRITKVERRIGKLENNMTVTHEQMQVIKTRINQIIVKLLGGMESNAYKDKSLRGKAYSHINRDYCDYFRINARANTLTSKFDEALHYLDIWQPDTNLKLRIEDCNAQMNMEVA